MFVVVLLSVVFPLSLVLTMYLSELCIGIGVMPFHLLASPASVELNSDGEPPRVDLKKKFWPGRVA